MNNKGQFFIAVILLIIMSVVLFGAAFFEFFGLNRDVEKFVGENQMAVSELYARNHNTQKFFDVAAGTAIPESLYDFERNGHYYECGSRENYAYWENITDKCYPSKERVRRNFAEVFVSKFNKQITNFALLEAFNISESQSSEINIDKSYITGLRFSTDKLSDDPVYLMQRSFKADSGFDFDYDSILQNVERIKEACKEKENYNVIESYELNDCVKTEIEKINAELSEEAGKNNNKAETGNAETEVWSLNCDGGDEAVINAFAEKFNNCFMSFDTDCSCGITPSMVSNFEFMEEDGASIAKFRDKKANLLQEFPQSFTTYEIFKKGNKLYSRDTWAVSPEREIRILAVDARTYPKCRYNDRTVKLCVSHPEKVSFREGEFKVNKKLQTKFAVYIPDASLPPSVDFTVDSSGVSFSASTAGDVFEYAILGVSKDISEPKWDDAEIMASFLRFDNIDGKRTVPISGMERLNIKVVAYDDNPVE